MGGPGAKVTAFSDGSDRVRIVETPDKKLFKLNGTMFSKLNKKSVYTGDYWDYFIPLAFALNGRGFWCSGWGAERYPTRLAP